MTLKYKLSDEKENGLYRIIALKDFGTLTGDVKAGEEWV